MHYIALKVSVDFVLSITAAIICCELLVYTVLRLLLYDAKVG